MKPCLGCSKPYAAHTLNPEDGREESCLLDGFTDTYSDPENWESFAEGLDDTTRRNLRKRARGCGVDLSAPAIPTFNSLERRWRHDRNM